MKFSKILLVIIILTTIGCSSKIEIQDEIKVTIILIETEAEVIHLQSKINIQCNEITEHGHCWSKEISEPILEIAKYSTYGPLTDTKEFTEDIQAGKGIVYIRAYIIVNNHIVYGETKRVYLL